MSDIQQPRRRLKFGLRGLFVATAIVGLLVAFVVRGWQRTQERLEYCNKAGAVGGHARTMQGFSFRVNRWSLEWQLFGDKEVTSISLYPGTYDDAHLAYLRNLFPEATITTYDGSD
jgi:hypothetical protein